MGKVFIKGDNNNLLAATRFFGKKNDAVKNSILYSCEKHKDAKMIAPNKNSVNGKH